MSDQGRPNGHDLSFGDSDYRGDGKRDRATADQHRVDQQQLNKDAGPDTTISSDLRIDSQLPCGGSCSANATCVNGACVCSSGFYNCNQSWGDGCECASDRFCEQSVCRPATLNDYWQGNAYWKYKYTISSDPQSYGWSTAGGTHIEVVNNSWYLFDRKVFPTNAYCPPGFPMSLQVRRSDDQGKTWTAPVPIINNAENTPWECAATDGDAYYDAQANKWHYLFQCMRRDLVWHGCHVEKSGADPMGLFSSVLANPVIVRGTLWSKICNQPSDHCVSLASGSGSTPVSDEGTFNIFHYDGTYYYVSFHGYDGARGYRGIAKTANFTQWFAGDAAQGLPSDAVFDPLDSASWRESWLSPGTIGGGAGSILYQGGYYYGVIEAADVNLNCTPGQNWDLGILRTAALTATTWQQFPQGNPIFYSSKWQDFPTASNPVSNGPCNIQYAHLFSDKGTVWLHYNRLTPNPLDENIYFYQLAASRNLLLNADLWQCDTSHWSVAPASGTNLAVYRFPQFASDHNCFLATNCGGSSCALGQGIYQDMPVIPHRNKRFTFGGNFMSQAGGASADFDVVVWQFDSANTIVGQDAVHVQAGQTYQTATSIETTIKPTATFIRYQLYLKDPAKTIWADELFVRLVP